jgi:crotonobetainyl-CoA:carnitine CoA-transferase CaiB-like acyl-CoA transferase
MDPLRIADFSTHLSGPICSHLLAEMGAEVIKVENPRTGDGNRGEFELAEGVGLFHLTLNSGTRSLTADRRKPEWPLIVEACARWADAVIVGTRPADARRRGMDFATMRAANPRIVYCSVSGYGDDGPWRDHTAHGQTIDSYAGLVTTEPGEVQPHTTPGWRSTGTTLGGVFAALAVLGAVNRRERGADHAQYLSVSLWHAALWWSWRDLTTLANANEPWVDYSDLGSRYSLYETADGRALLICPVEHKFWQRFCELAELPGEVAGRGDWGGSGMEFGKGSDFDDERRLIASRISTRPLEEWTERLARAEIPFAPVLSVGEALSSEHAAANGVMRTTTVDGREFQLPASPVRIAEADCELSPPGPLSSPPELGADRDEVLRELGLEELTATAASGAELDSVES